MALVLLVAPIAPLKLEDLQAQIDEWKQYRVTYEKSRALAAVYEPQLHCGIPRLYLGK